MTVVLFYAERIIVFGERTFYQLTEIYTSMFKNPGLKRRTRRITLRKKQINAVKSGNNSIAEKSALTFVGSYVFCPYLSSHANAINALNYILGYLKKYDSTVKKDMFKNAGFYNYIESTINEEQKAIENDIII